MSETKKPTDEKAKTTPEEELSEEHLEKVAGGVQVDLFLDLKPVLTVPGADRAAPTFEAAIQTGSGARKTPI